MIRDILDVFNPRHRFTLTGKYYEDRPISTDAGGEEFNFEYVNPYSNTWRSLFANIQANVGETAIRTDDQLSFTPGKGVVILNDGKAYLIEEKSTDYQAAPKQTFRVLPTPVGTEYVLRVKVIENPWGIE